MKVGDIIINPYVAKYFDSKPNPLYQSMVISIGKEYTTTLRYDGKTSKYYTNHVKEWDVLRSVNLYELIYSKDIAEEDGYKQGRNDAIDEIKTYLFDMLCGKDGDGYIGKHCHNKGRCSETVCNWKLIENKLKQMKEGK